MQATNKLKIFNDPIYGFITIPNALIFDVIEHPVFQRLRRISQMGMSYLVYPGAHHTRFHHALGAMHLMQQAVEVLRFKGTNISEEEEQALYLAILLHDIGHGPFSHALEQEIVLGMHHESISLRLMEYLNEVFEGKLTLAIAIFKGTYSRKFMNQLVSSQLDMDRLDYLKRDSFYSGVAEGNINSDRLIKMLQVHQDELVLEEKSIYSVEKFLMARRLMYWQAYLHKTSLVAELMLLKTIQRARKLIAKGVEVTGPKHLLYFLSRLEQEQFSKEDLSVFIQLDDHDIMVALKEWKHHPDKVLSELSKRLLDRNLLKVKFLNQAVSQDSMQQIRNHLQQKLGWDEALAKHLVFKGKIKTLTYNKTSEPIKIIYKNGTVEVLEDASPSMSHSAHHKPDTKHYAVFPKEAREVVNF